MRDQTCSRCGQLVDREPTRRLAVTMLIWDHADLPMKPNLPARAAVTSPRISTAPASGVALGAIGPNVGSTAAAWRTPISWNSPASRRSRRGQLRTVEGGRSSCSATARCLCLLAARCRAVPTASVASRRRQRQQDARSTWVRRQLVQQARRGRMATSDPVYWRTRRFLA